MNRLDSFLSQLDGLVVFLAAAREEVFDLIHANELTWFPLSQDPRAPETAMAYQAAISNAAFLLGYAYLESFLADILKEVYLRRPEILPREKQLKYEEIISTASREDLINLMIAKEVRSVLGTSIEDVKEHFERRLSVPWPDQPKILIASKIRNCLMRNGARVDQRLAAANESFVLDSIVSLQIGDVHEYGLAARYFADEL